MGPVRLTYYRGFQVHHDRTGHVLAGPCLVEEGVEGVVPASDCLVAGHLTVGLDAVLQAVQLPAGIADLHAGLAHMDGDYLTLGERERERERERGRDLR